MADDTVVEEPKVVQQQKVDVFTHSSTGFPGAWSEEDISALLEAWEDVVNLPRSPSRRFDAAQKVIGRLRKKGFRWVEKEDVKKQMNTLRTEYKTYLGLVKIGIPTQQAPCLDRLEKILGKAGDGRPARRRQDSETANNVDGGASEDSDYSHRLSVGDEEGGANKVTTTNNEAGNDEASNQTKRVRFQRRMSIQRVLKAMINQQQATSDNIQRVLKTIEDSNVRMIDLLTELVSLQKLKGTSVGNQTSEVVESTVEDD
ncbi:uncharacterized protein LOC129227056 [Uloborus diversus]|uniref:uncharacterized protein LOC129227056 n=1 Tax=Uloborus diversus TaxID=327109 RepID=UPI00240A9A70|nr:uncharacterized protein LOC129227056 [Uloborus diversus]